MRCKHIPTPGSDEAIKMGCTCPVMDNAHGKGFSGVTIFASYTMPIARCITRNTSTEKTNMGR